MSIYFGNDTVNDLYIGLTPVTKGYVGTHLFYNGDNTIIDLTYEKYILNTQSSTLYNTAEKPVKSAILKGNTKYRDIVTGDILDTFDETKNLELVSVQMPVLTTSNLGNLVSMYNLEQGGLFNSTGVEVNVDVIRSDFIEVEYAKYTLSHNGSAWTKIFEYDENKKFIRMTNTRADKHTAEVTNTTRYIRAVIELPYSKVNSLNISLCPSESTNKEPYKSNILTVNEDVTLRSNGNVYDELNLLTGRLTQRINENNEVLAQAVVKTVDLSIVNQDGNNTNLSTFNDITHVMVSSGGLIPVVELEVATKNEEVLNTMSLEMDNISTTQNTLEETSNAQSENVDATMIATTEIYEQLL